MKLFTQKPIQFCTLLLSILILFLSCSSTTYIDSYPSGANLYLNDEDVGQTPYRMSDSKPIFSCTSVRIEKEDYRTVETTICRDEEVDVVAFVGGLFFVFPFLWTLKYKDSHFYTLLSTKSKKENSFNSLIENQQKSK